MTTYSKKNLPYKLEHGDEILFEFGSRKKLEYTVETGDWHLFHDSEPNDLIFDELGIDKIEFCTALAGDDVSNDDCDFPEVPTPEALLRIVLGLFSVCAGGKAEGIIAAAKGDDDLSLSEEDRKKRDAIKEALAEGDWGCQERSVYNLISKVTGFKFTA